MAKAPRTIEVFEVIKAGIKTQGHYQAALVHVEAATGTEYLLEISDIDAFLAALVAARKALASQPTTEVQP